MAPTFLICLLILASVPAMAGTLSHKQGFEAFQLVQARNIFDPKRSTDASLHSAVAPKPTAPPAAANDYAALTGIMITDGKTLAFFTGSRPEFNKVLSANSVIAGATISKISATAIEIQRDGKEITVAIGQTVPLDANATPAPAPFTPPSAPTPAGPASAPSSDASATSPERDTAMRRMMERRKKELK